MTGVRWHGKMPGRMNLELLVKFDLRFLVGTLVLCAFAFSTAAPRASQLAQQPDGYRKLSGAEIRRLFEDLHLANYPDDGSGGSDVDWAITFNANGTFDGDAFSNGDNGYGTWRVEGDRHCLEVDTVHYQNFGDGSEPLSGCFDVFVHQKNGTIAFGDSGGGALITIEDGAYGEIARLEPAQQLAAAPVAAPKRRVAAPSVEQVPVPKRSDDTVEAQRLALERERLAAEAKLKEMRLQLERERVRQEMALQRQKIDLQRQAMILQRQKRKHGVSQDMSPPLIRVPAALETKSKIVAIEGVVTDDDPVVRVEVNGEAIRFGREDGRFAAEVPVKMGRSEIRIAAYDVDGNRAQQIVSVIRLRDIPNIEFGTYRALVIGINDYKQLPALKTAVADARAVAETLETKYGFTVQLLINPSRDDIIDAFDDLRETLTEDDNLIIYYAGHGWLDQQSGRGYWLPVDARQDRRSRWLANSSLTDTLQATFAKHVMVVADSCYSGALTRSIKVPERRSDYIAHMVQKRARIVLSSGGLEPVADSGGGKHSVFAAQFLKALDENEGVIDGTQLFEKICHAVVLNADQTPEYSDIRKAGHEGGDFLFVRRD